MALWHVPSRVSCSTIFIAHLQVEANTERARAEQSQRTTPCLTEEWGEVQRLFCCLGFIRPVLPGTKPYTNPRWQRHHSAPSKKQCCLFQACHQVDSILSSLCCALSALPLSSRVFHTISTLHVFYTVFCTSITKSISSSQLTLLQLTTALPSLPLSALLPPRGTPVTLAQHPKAVTINQTPFPGHQLLC